MIPRFWKGATMQHAKCPACGAGFEVDFEPGTEFTCGGCGGTVVVPAPEAPRAPAAARPPVGRPPVGRPAQPARSAPRPGAAAPRPARAAAGARDPAPAKKPPNMLLIGGAGAALVIGVVLFIVLGGGDKSPKQSPATSGNSGTTGTAAQKPETVPAKVPDPPKKPRPTEPLAAARYDAEQPNAGATEFLALANMLWSEMTTAQGAGDNDKVKSLREEALKAYESVLRIEKSQPTARERLGFVPFVLADAEGYAKAEYLPRKLRQDISDTIDQMKSDAGGKDLPATIWLNPRSERQKDLANDWRKVLREAERRTKVEREKATDPFYKRSESLVAGVEKDVGDFLKRRGVEGNCFVGFPFKPFVIIVQRDKNYDPEAVAMRWGETLEQLRDTFFERFGKKFNLAEMDRPTPVLVLRYDSDYSKYLRKSDSRAQISSAAHFEPWSKRLVTWAEVDNTDSKTQKGISEDEVRTTLFHEGTHQLMDFYTTQRLTNSGESLWFSEGIADYFGGHGRAWDTTDGRWRYEPGLINEGRVKELAEAKSGGYLFKLEDLLVYKRSDYERDKNMPNDPRPRTAYAEGWGLVYYLANWNDGKLRPKFEEYVKLEMSGRSGRDAFLTVFGNDLAAIEKDFHAMIDALGQAAKDKKIVNGRLQK